MKADSVLGTIGNTPHIRMARLFPDHEVWIKSERANPGGSIKDRIALAMIEAAEVDGSLQPGGTIIEPTSGNTGVGLAMVAAVKGYKLVLVMPESMSLERRKMLLILGAKTELTPAAAGMRGAIARAEQLLKEIPDSFMPQQFANAANPAVHKRTTAEEIWHDTDGGADVLISGVGTGGTLTGVAEILKARKPSFKAIAVEPEDSPVLSGGVPGPHKIQGIGAGFIPPILNTGLIDEVIRISNTTAIDTARLSARIEGLPVGISSGAALAAAIEVGTRPDMAGKQIIVIIPSFAERYLSTALFEGLT